jgi:hypothetical protein
MPNGNAWSQPTAAPHHGGLGVRTWPNAPRGTVREDHSADGSAWNYFPHDHARSRVYRWNEDGMAGFCDESQNWCLALALWNGADPIVKERMFGLSGPEGNHGEDVKEYWWYLDGTPTHSWHTWRYHYPQRAYPYDELIAENLVGGDAADRPAHIDLADGYDAVMAARKAEAAAVYAVLTPTHGTQEEARVLRQAFAGLLWSKQFFHLDVQRWLDGDPGQPAPPPGRGRSATATGGT